MMNLNLRGLCACTLACALSASSVHAAPSKPTPPPKSESPAPAGAQLPELERARQELARLAERVDGLSAQVKALKDERKKLDGTKTTLERDWKRQLANAERARQRYDKASPAAQSKPEATQWLETARSEYGSALATAARLQQQRAAAKKVDAALYAQAMLLQKAQAELDKLADTFERAQTSLDEWTKRLDTQHGAVGSAAKLVRTRSGFAGAGSLQAAQKANEQRLANVNTAIADSEARLARVEQAVAATSSKPANAAAAPTTSCPALASSGFAAGSYLSSRKDVRLKLVIAPECGSPSVLSGARGGSLAAGVIAPQLKGGQRKARLATEEGDLCGGYTLSANAAGNIVVSWETDIGSGSSRAAIGTGCKSVEGEYVREVTAGGVAPAVAAASAPGKACDPKLVDWKNLQDGKLKLKNGAAQGDDYMGYQLQDVYYADLDGNGSSEALLMLDCHACGPVMTSFGTLYGYGLDASCKPKLLGEVDANNFSEPEVKGRVFVFGRANVYANAEDGSGPGQDDERVECGLVNGKFVATKVTAE